jgi:uncharacterized protein (DUF433 family)
MNRQDRISLDPKNLVGKYCVKGMRLGVEFVIDQQANGWTKVRDSSNYPKD